MENNPIHGNPEEFKNLESLFSRIKNGTRNLEEGLSSIALGTSQHFQGAAAEAFSENINKLAPALREVPTIAQQIEKIFCHHWSVLVGLKNAAYGKAAYGAANSAVDSAVGRAETNWKLQREADSEHDRVSGQLNAVSNQLNFLVSWLLDDEERTQLERRRDELEGDTSVARARLTVANENLQKSENELRSLANSEDALNEETAKKLENVDVGVLADPGWFEKLLGDLPGIILAIAGGLSGGLLQFVIPTDVLQWIYDHLDDIITALTILAILVAVVAVVFTGGASLVFLLSVASFLSQAAFYTQVVKFGIGVELYKRKLFGDDEVTISGTDVLMDGAGVLLGHGLNNFGNGIANWAAKAGRPILGQAGSTIVPGVISLGIGEVDTAIRDAANGPQDDWAVCEAAIPFYDGTEFGSGLDQVTVPEFAPSAEPVDIRIISIVPFDMPDLNVNINDLADFSVGDFDGMVENFGDFNFDVPGIALSLDLGSHFSFDPPSIIFEDFYSSFDQNLRPLMAPCE